MASEFLIVGLGNPGPRYERTRHNAGFMCVEHCAAGHGIVLGRRQHQAIVGEGKIAGRRSLLALPQTFMNRSGESVRRILSFTDAPPSSLIVIHDDLDLPLGRLRLRQGGGPGGHRGVASVIDHLGVPDFIRLRIGIGRPPDGVPADMYVLQEFSAGERQQLRDVIDRGGEALEMLISEGLEKTMSRYNAGG